MNEYLKIFITGLILILLIACAKRQRRYWREMCENRPTGSLRAGYTLAIITIFLSLSAALYSNSTTGWEVFIGILLMTLIFCVKITFSPAVIALVLGICTYQLHTSDNFPFFEVWGAAVSVLAWRLPEEFRIFYTTLSFLWVMVVLLSGGNPEVTSADDVADVTTVLHP